MPRLILPSILLALLPAAVQAQADPPSASCSLMGTLVMARHDTACAGGGLRDEFDRALDRYIAYFARNGTQPEGILLNQITAARDAPLRADYDCEATPAASVHASIVEDIGVLTRNVDQALAVDRPGNPDMRGCFPGLRN